MVTICSKQTSLRNMEATFQGKSWYYGLFTVVMVKMCSENVRSRKNVSYFERKC